MMITRPLKRGLKLLWRATFPLRRPLLRKLDSYLRPMNHFVAEAEEMTMVMDHVVRELVHLQRQHEELRETIEELVSRLESPPIECAREDEIVRSSTAPRLAVREKSSSYQDPIAAA
jgi:hypothetical protein